MLSQRDPTDAHGPLLPRLSSCAWPLHAPPLPGATQRDDDDNGADAGAEATQVAVEWSLLSLREGDEVILRNSTGDVEEYLQWMSGHCFLDADCGAPIRGRCVRSPGAEGAVAPDAVGHCECAKGWLNADCSAEQRWTASVGATLEIRTQLNSLAAQAAFTAVGVPHMEHSSLF